jgi:hypothetical protein
MTQAAQVPCFRNIAAHLEPGGFVIEVMIPDPRTRLKTRDEKLMTADFFRHLRRFTKAFQFLQALGNSSDRG